MSGADETIKVPSAESQSSGFDRAVALVGAGAGVRAASIVITSGVSLVTTAFLVRILGASLYGALALGLSIVALSAALSKFGFGVAATRTIAAHRTMGETEQATDTTRGVTTIVWISGAIGFTVVVTSVLVTQAQLAAATRLAVGVGLGCLLIGRDAAAAANAVARGFGRVLLMELPALAEVLSKFVFVVALFALGETHLSTTAACLGASGLVAFGVAVAVVHRVSSVRLSGVLRPSLGAAFRLLRIGIPYAMVGVAARLIASFDVLILGVSHPGAPAGAYAPVLTLLEASVMLGPMLLTSLFVAAATELFTRRDDEGFSRLYVTVSKFSVLLAMPAFCLLAVSPTIVIRSLFGSDFPVDDKVVRILLVGFFINVAFGVNTQALIASGGRWKLARALAVPAITMVCLSLVLIPPYEAFGAAIATSASFVILNVMMSWTLYRTTNVHPIHKDLVLVVLTTPLMILAEMALEATLDANLVSSVASTLVVWVTWCVLITTVGIVPLDELRALLPHSRVSGNQGSD